MNDGEVHTIGSCHTFPNCEEHKRCARDLKRAIDEEAPFALSVIDRVVNDLSKELNDRLFGRQRRTLLNDVNAIG